MKSVPPCGSGWVIDSELDTMRYQALTARMQAEPTRYREVVLTSCRCIESESVIANSDAEIIAFASELLEGWNLLRCLSFLDGLNDFVNTRQ